MARRERVWGSLLLVVGGVLYSDWVLQLVLPVSSEPGSAPVSSLSAPGEPWAWAFRTSDATAGVLVAIGVGLALRERLRGVPRTALVSAAVIGLTNVALALLPEECGDPGSGGSGPPPCSDVRLLEDPHTALSLVQDLSVAATAAILLVSAWRAPRWGRVLFAVVVLVAWIASWLTGGGSFLGDPAVGFGWWQRAFVSLTSAMLVVVGLRLGAHRRQDAAR